MRYTDVHKVYGNYALVKAAVVFCLTLLVNVGGEEGAAAHTGVAMTFAILVHLVFKHNFFGDIVGYHTLGGACCGKMGKVVEF